MYLVKSLCLFKKNNITMHSLIAWQKWFDPFGSDDTQIPDHDPYLGEYDDLDTEENTFDDESENKIVEEKTRIDRTGKIRVIATPMGIIPVTENTISSKIFNFWIGHSNFDITHRIAGVIEETDGVETLDIFTRYRFRIAIGKAFDDSSVMRDINNRVYSELSR